MDRKSNDAVTVAVLGVTGAVGEQMLRVLEEHTFPVGRLVPLASARSAGTTVRFQGEDVAVQAVSEGCFDGVDIALFSAGAGPSREWAPKAAAAGAVVVDNSSAWRRDDAVPLVVPEVNAHAIADRPRGIIANPNCSTIQMVVALAPLAKVSRIRRIVVATYQAISGSGTEAIDAFLGQEAALVSGGEVDRSKLSGQLARNVLMHWSRDVESGYQEEELKMLHETRKIFGDPEIRVSPTAVRVPVISGHAEALTVEFAEPLSAARARELLEAAPGVTVVDDFAEGVYPQPIDAVGKDDVFVGRIRDDIGNPGGLQLWVVSDNLRKGAATNAVQIAAHLIR